jgi:hypothetical protein
MMEMLLTEPEILERIDEYALYSFYLGYEPLLGAVYPSPIRKGMKAGADTQPSFSVYEPTRRVFSSRDLMWTDNALGVSGGIFKLIRLMFGFTTEVEAFHQALGDFGLIHNHTRRAPLDLPEKKYAVHADISIVSRPFEAKDLNLWARWNITLSLLQRYNTKAVKCFWIAEQQRMPQYPRGLGYAYSIWDKYQVYCPFDPKRKFRTSFNEACLPGFLQLEYNSDTLIITKSMKDVMCLRSFGYEAVAVRSENVLVPQPYMEHFRKKYARILILFDNDGKHKGAEYAEPKIFVPKLLEGDKDTTDFCNNHGIPSTAEMLYQIIG